MGDVQQDVRDAVQKYADALKSGALTVEEVNQSMKSLKELRERFIDPRKDEDFDQVNVTLPQPVLTRDAEAGKKADDMLNLGRMVRDNQRAARDAQNAVRHQIPLIRQDMKGELPKAEKALLDKFLLEQHKKMVEAVGPKKAKEMMDKVFVEASRKELLATKDQKQNAKNAIKAFEGLKAKAGLIQKRDRDNAKNLAEIAKNTRAKVQ